MRLDVYLTEKGLTKSRSQAAECIKTGLVSVNGSNKVKSSMTITDDDNVELLGVPHNYVGRGGLKLEHALEFFGIDVTGMSALDIGASTGGFTDCLLKRGASSVIAIDSGHGQLDPLLEENPAVTSLEGFNARDLSPETIGKTVDIAVADVSFISQTLILAPASSVLKNGGIYIGLIKPQFECGASALGKNGIVKDKKQHRHAITKVTGAGIAAGFSVIGITSSPITGGDGNKEFLVCMIKDGKGTTPDNFGSILSEVCK